MKIFFCIALLFTSVFGAENKNFMEEEKEWREKRDQRLRSEEGWLTLAGLHWLREGENVLPLSKERAAVSSVTFVLREGKVMLKMLDGLGKALQSDEAGNPDIVRLGELRLNVIKRGDRLGVRIKDPQSPTRVKFKGIDYFPSRRDYQVEAKFITYEKPKDVSVATVIDTPQAMKALGYVKFRLNNKELTLEPYIEEPDDKELFYIFKDETSGKETYEAGRFLYSEMPKNGKVILNFNRSYNPPCALTKYSTCPLPPPRNWLSTKIEAGEKKYRH